MSAFAVGQQATVSVVYETATPYQSQFNHQAFYVNAFSSVTFTSGAYSGTDNTGSFGWANVYNNLPVWWQSDPYDGVSFVAASNPGHYTFTSGGNTVDLPDVVSNGVTQTFQSLRINLEANHSTALSSFALPEDLTILPFTNRNMLFGFSGGSFMTGINSLSVENLTPPPPPPPPASVPDGGSTALLLLTAAAGLAVAAAKRR